jgi:PAS domain S-box-containing protein
MSDKDLEHHFPEAIAEIKGFAIFMIDTDGIIQTWNIGCELLKGYKAEEAIGHNYEILFPDFLKEKNYPEKERQQAKETGRFESENWRRKKNGDLFWAHVVLTKVLDENGNHIGFIKITQDHTDKKHFLEQLNIKIEEIKNINDELVRSNKRLEEFAYASSHDLQAPLRKISLFVDRLKNELWEQLNINHQELFNRVGKSTNRMKALIEDLLTFSYFSKGIGVINEIDLNRQVDEVLEDLEIDILEKKATFRVEELPKIRGDKRQFQQLFQNLISNALKYTNTNVEPIIEISSVEATGFEAKDNLPAEAADKHFHLIQLKDNGIGFEQEFAEDIFKIFTRLNGGTNGSGTGVGLSIVQKVVENHQGFVWAESKPGEGAVFKILLPVNNMQD